MAAVVPPMPCHWLDICESSPVRDLSNSTALNDHELPEPYWAAGVASVSHPWVAKFTADVPNNPFVIASSTR